MFEKQKISVIVPSFNTGRYIKNAIDSALEQTYKNLEIIVVDDGSRDDTRNLLSPYIKRGLIKYYYQNNAGLSASRNYGINKADGKYIALLDADDLWKTDKLRLQLEAINSKDTLAMVFTDFDVLDDNGLLFNGRCAVNFDDGVVITFKELFNNYNFILPSTVLVKKEVFNKCGFFDTSLEACEDYDMWLRITRAFDVAGINSPLTCIRLRPSSMSSNVTAMLQNELRVIAKYENSVSHQAYLRKKAKIFMINADRCIGSRPDYKKGIGYFCRGLMTYPLLFTDALVIFMKFILGYNLMNRLRRRLDSMGWLKNIHLFLYRR